MYIIIVIEFSCRNNLTLQNCLMYKIKMDILCYVVEKITVDENKCR